MTKDEIDGIRLRQQMRRSIGVSSSITVFDEELMSDADALLLEIDLLRALAGLKDGEMVPRIGDGLRAVNEKLEEEARAAAAGGPIAAELRRRLASEHRMVSEILADDEDGVRR